MAQAVAEITRWIEDGERHYVCVTGVHGVMESPADPELRAIHNASGLTTPDGMPMVWAGHWAGVPQMRARLRPRPHARGLCPRGRARLVVVLLRRRRRGARAAGRAADRSASPGSGSPGRCSPPFRPLTPEEDEAVVERINRAGADLVWVGLSTPKQERWMAAHVGRLRRPGAARRRGGLRHPCRPPAPGPRLDAAVGPGMALPPGSRATSPVAAVPAQQPALRRRDPPPAADAPDHR